MKGLLEHSIFCCRKGIWRAIAAATLTCLVNAQDDNQQFIDPRIYLAQPPGVNWTTLSWTHAWNKLPPSTSPTFNYAEALHKAFIYLRVQRSGNITGPDFDLAWRSNSCFTCKVVGSDNVNSFVTFLDS